MVMRKSLNFMMPYSFKGVHLDLNILKKQKIRFLAREKVAFYIDDNIFKSFDSIYDNVLSALAEKDLAYLESIMENKLFKATQAALEKLEAQNYKLKYIKDSQQEGSNNEELEEEDEESQSEENAAESRAKSREKLVSSIQQSFDKFKDPEQFKKSFPYIYKLKDMKINVEANGVFGLDIDREANSKKKFLKLNLPGTKRTIFMNPLNVLDVYKKQILVLNVFYLTNRKLYIIDEDGDLVEGEDDLIKFLHHRWRFETNVPDLDWVLTDMDDHLKGNPYT